MRFEFPIWTNRFVPLLLGGILAGAGYVGACVYASTMPSTLNLGYKPTQPVPFSHKTHAGKLKMDCRYCHNTVFEGAHAAVPATSTCVNCHSSADSSGQVKYAAVGTDSLKLAPVHRSQTTGEPIPWVKVHDLPDFVYFNHSAHVNRGVSCVSCHGRVDQMEVVEQVKTLSMTFCLECHRNPDPHLRPLDKVTDLSWLSEEPAEVIGKRVREQLGVNPNTNCNSCHR